MNFEQNNQFNNQPNGEKMFLLAEKSLQSGNKQQAYNLLKQCVQYNFLPSFTALVDLIIDNQNAFCPSTDVEQILLKGTKVKDGKSFAYLGLLQINKNSDQYHIAYNVSKAMENLIQANKLSYCGLNAQFVRNYLDHVENLTKEQLDQCVLLVNTGVERKDIDCYVLKSEIILAANPNEKEKQDAIDLLTEAANKGSEKAKMYLDEMSEHESK